MKKKLILLLAAWIARSDAKEAHKIREDLRLHTKRERNRARVREFRARGRRLWVAWQRPRPATIEIIDAPGVIRPRSFRRPSADIQMPPLPRLVRANH